MLLRSSVVNHILPSEPTFIIIFCCTMASNTDYLDFNLVTSLSCLDSMHIFMIFCYCLANGVVLQTPSFQKKKKAIPTSKSLNLHETSHDLLQYVKISTAGEETTFSPSYHPRGHRGIRRPLV